MQGETNVWLNEWQAADTYPDDREKHLSQRDRRRLNQSWHLLNPKVFMQARATEAICPKKERMSEPVSARSSGWMGERMSEARLGTSVLEVFSPPRISTVAVRLGLVLGSLGNLDLTTGWDVRRAQDRQLAWIILKISPTVLSAVWSALPSAQRTRATGADRVRIE